MLNYCGKFHYNQLINKGVTIQDGRQMDYILCFSVILLPIDSEMAGPIGLKLSVMVEGKCENNLTKRFFGYFKFKMAAKTWWNGREHTRECPHEGLFLIF